MIGRTLILEVAALAFCLSAVPAVAHAKACPAKCKTEIKDCRQTWCVGLTHKARRTCVHSCKATIVAACKAAKNPTACSPSGAFLD